jgi:Fur family ferric uptake transcriptional regulator
MIIVLMNQRQYATLLQSAGLRATAQRISVVEALEGRRTAVSAQQLHGELRGRGGATGLATVYRTLQALAEAGAVDSFVRDGELAYRLCGAKHHHHLVCESCGSVEEVGAEQVESWIRTIAKRRGFTVTGHTVDVFGSCRDCR